jgi:glycosyltransferase involved in cell wall biosynthesis
LPKALVISRHFPPLGSAGGSIRLVKFLKYTSLNGWKFVVLTQDLEKTVVSEERLSTSLLDDIPMDTQVERVPAPFRKNSKGNLGSFFSKTVSQIGRAILRDSSIAWGVKVFLRGAFNLKEWKIDLIYSVSPPFTDAFIGALLAVISRKPYVLDLKDDWVGSPDFLRKSLSRQTVEKLLEKMIVASSAAVLTVTQQSHLLYSKRYIKPGKNNKIFLIPNGCDLEEYNQLAGLQRKITTQKFTVLSAIWGFRKDYRDLTPFLSSLAVFFERHPEAKKNFSVILLGNSMSQEYHNTIEKLGLKNIIQEMDAVNRKDLIDLMWVADLFLLIQPAGNTTAISGTLYEYWAVGKAPILLISERGASSSLIESFNIGRHFHFSEIEKCTNYIENLYRKYQAGTPEWISREGLENFDRRKLAEQVEKVWSETLIKR